MLCSVYTWLFNTTSPPRHSAAVKNTTAFIASQSVHIYLNQYGRRNTPNRFFTLTYFLKGWFSQQ